jgi:hypothetical protein
LSERYISASNIPGLMDPDLAEALRIGIFSIAGFGSIYAIARYSYMKRKSNNETYAARKETDMKAEQQRLEHAEKKLKLMSSPEFKDYQQKRIDMAEKLIGDDEVIIRAGPFGATLDAVVGHSPLEDDDF